MADLYSVISGIEVDQQDILEAELFAKQLIEAEFPDLDLREGTGIRDVTLRPSAFILALCKKGLDYFFSQRTVGNVDDTTDSTIVDDLMSNLFLTRNTGNYAMINARLYFARQKTVSLSSSTSFSTDGSLLFYPPVSVSYPDSAMQFDSFSNEWFLDVELVAAEKGASYNISSGSLLYFNNFDPYFLRADINYLSEKSTGSETNLEFISRASTAVSTRNLINQPSILSNVQQNFNYMSRLSVVGAGDVEMHRDQVIVSGYRGTQRTSTSATMSPGYITLDLIDHGFIVGQKLNLAELVTDGITTPYVVNGASVYQVLSSSQFIAALPITLPVRDLFQFSITPVDDDLYMHVGGCVDVYCGDEISSEIQTLTVGSDNTVYLTGPIMEVISTPESGDTVTSPAFSLSYDGHKVRYDISVSYFTADSTVRVIAKNHGLTKSRLVKLSDFPSTGAISYLPVTEVVDEDTFSLGSSISAVTVQPGITPSIRIVDPYKDTGASDNQKITLTMNTPQVGNTFSVTVYSWDKVSDLQAYLDTPTNSVICAQYLARGFNVYWVTIAASAYEATGSQATAQSAAVSYLAGLSPGDPLITADLVSKIYEAGVTALTLPLNISYTLYTRDVQMSSDGSSLGVTNTVTDIITPFSMNSVFLLKNLTLTVNAQ